MPPTSTNSATAETTTRADEISRCRPDMQNKLFPIIHEKRLQGIELDMLVYRWAEMNPPCTEDNDSKPEYFGSEPLDPALADRFAFIAEVPAWEQFSDDDKERVIRSDSLAVAYDIAQALKADIETGRQLFISLRAAHEAGLAGYVRVLLTLLSRAGANLSPRRAGMMLRNVIAVHAARLIACPKAKLKDSALLAVSHSLPQPAQGINVDRVKLLAAHREAWKTAQFSADDPCRAVLAESDPVRRVMKASRTSAIPATEFSGIVADAIAALPNGARHALAFGVFGCSAASSRLVDAVAE